MESNFIKDMKTKSQKYGNLKIEIYIYIGNTNENKKKTILFQNQKAIMMELSEQKLLH